MHPRRAEAILQVRAASLCDDERLSKHLRAARAVPSPADLSHPKPNLKKIRS